MPASPDVLIALLWEHGSRSVGQIATPAINIARRGRCDWNPTFTPRPPRVCGSSATACGKTPSGDKDFGAVGAILVSADGQLVPASDPREETWADGR